MIHRSFTLRLRVEKKHKRTLHSVCPNQRLLANLNRQDAAAHVSLSLINNVKEPDQPERPIRISLETRAQDSRRKVPEHLDDAGKLLCRAMGTRTDPRGGEAVRPPSLTRVI